MRAWHEPAPVRRSGALASPAGVATIEQVQRYAGNREMQRLARGARMLQRSDKDAEDAWKKAGPFGDKVYKLLADALTPAEIAKLLKEVPGLGKDLGKGLASDKVGLDEQEAAKLGEGLGEWTKKAATKWIEGPSGKKFLAAVKKSLGENAQHWYGGLVELVVVALGAAILLYQANKLDPPNLEKEIKLSDKVSITPGLDLGKPEEFWLQSAKFALKYNLDPRLAMTWMAAITSEKDKGYFAGGGYTLKLGDDKKPDFKLDVGGKYGWDKGIYGGYLNLGGGPLSGGYSFETTPGVNTKHTFTMKAEVLKKALLVEAKGVMNTSGKGDSLAFSAGGKAGGFDYKGAVDWNLSDNDISKLTLHLGFKSKDETLTWLAELTHSAKGEKTEVHAEIRKKLGDYVLGLDASGGVKKDSPFFSMAIGLGISLPGKFVVTPLLGMGYGGTTPAGTGTPAWMFQPGVGVGHKDMPVMPYVNLNVPIGGGEAFPTLGVTGHF